MPPKKISLSDKRQRSCDRERMRTRRESETDEESSQRREKCAVRMTIRRQNETEEESSQRKVEEASRQAINRQNQTEEESSQKRKENAERMAIHRQNEPEQEREHRRKLDSERKAESRGRPKLTHNLGLKITDIEEYYIGPMDEICSDCQSINFKNEKPSDGKFSSYCHKGKVVLDPLRPYPELSKKLLTDINHPKHKNFIENIRAYNSALGFASIGATIRPPPGQGPYCFRIHGQIYHRVGPLHPIGEEPPRFAQLYILDSDEALNKRMAVKENERCDPQLMARLDSLIRRINEYAKGYKMMRELEFEEEQRAKKEKRTIN
jgi:hypothetical protein